MLADPIAVDNVYFGKDGVFKTLTLVRVGKKELILDQLYETGQERRRYVHSRRRNQPKAIGSSRHDWWTVSGSTSLWE